MGCPEQKQPDRRPAFKSRKTRRTSIPARPEPATAPAWTATPNDGYLCTERGPAPIAERDPISGALGRALQSSGLVVI